MGTRIWTGTAAVIAASLLGGCAADMGDDDGLEVGSQKDALSWGDWFHDHFMGCGHHGYEEPEPEPIDYITPEGESVGELPVSVQWEGLPGRGWHRAADVTISATVQNTWTNKAAVQLVLTSPSLRGLELSPLQPSGANVDQPCNAADEDENWDESLPSCTVLEHGGKDGSSKGIVMLEPGQVGEVSFTLADFPVTTSGVETEITASGVATMLLDDGTTTTMNVFAEPRFVRYSRNRE